MAGSYFPILNGYATEFKLDGMTNLPAGLKLNAETGEIYGTAMYVGEMAVTIKMFNTDLYYTEATVNIYIGIFLITSSISLWPRCV